MASRTQARRKPNKDDWEMIKSEIRKLLLQEKKDTKDIARVLELQGWNINKKQLEYRLKQWRFRQKLTPNHWQYIDHKVRKRKKEAGKDSLVLLSGERVSLEKVTRNHGRHALPVMGVPNSRPCLSPKPPDNDLPLEIYTPPPLTSLDEENFIWPKDLPWRLFMERDWHSTSGAVGWSRFQQDLVSIDGNYSPSSLPILRRLCSTPTSQEPVLDNVSSLVLNAMAGSVESKQTARSLMGVNNPACVAARLNQLVPEVERDENLRRAVVLLGPSSTEMYTEILKLLIYLASNNLLGGACPMLPAYYQGYTSHRKLIKLCRALPVNNRNMIANLLSLAPTDLTIGAFLQVLFDAALYTHSKDILSALVLNDASDSVVRQRRVKHFFGMGSVMVQRLGHLFEFGDFGLIEAVLDNLCNADGRLQFEVPPDERVCVLHMATARGNVKLVELLVRYGANPFHSTRHSHEISLGLDCTLYRSNRELMTSVRSTFNCLDLAVLCQTVQGPPTTWDCEHHGPADLTLQDTMSERSQARIKNNIEPTRTIVEYFLSLQSTASTPEDGVGWSVLDRSSALCLASAVGNNCAIMPLQQDGADINGIGLRISPLSLALDRGRHDTCRLLLNLGANPRKIDKWTCKSKVPSLLHIAAWHTESLELAKSLLQLGADIQSSWVIDGNNLQRLIKEKVSAEYLIEFVETFIRGGYSPNRPYPITPLDIAIMKENLALAALLVESGAVPTHQTLEYAAYQCCPDVIRFVVSTMQGPLTCDQQGCGALRSTLHKCSEEVVIDLISAGHSIDIDGSALSLAIRRHFHVVVGFILCLIPEVTEDNVAHAFRYGDVHLIELLLENVEKQGLKSRHRMGKSHDSRTCLEMAYLSRNIHNIDIALALDTAHYDSGSLCAAVTGIMLVDGLPIRHLEELIRRRSQRLLAHGEGVDAEIEATALSIALYGGRLELVRLIHYDALPGNRSILPHSEYWTATKPGDHGLTGLLRLVPCEQADAQLASDFLTTWDLWHHRKRALDLNDTYASPLFWALKGGREDAILELRQMGYKADALTLRSAIRHNISVDTMEKLAESCDEIDSEYKTMWREELYKYECTPLQLASAQGRLGYVQCLLRNGADPNCPPSHVSNEIPLKQATAVQLAIGRGDVELVTTLIEAGADIHTAAYQHGVTSLQVAALLGQIQMVSFLLRRGVNIDAPRGRCSGRTALEGAAEQGRLDIVQLLLANGVNTEGKCRVQYLRAIHFARERNSTSIEKLLRDHRPWTQEDDRIWGDKLVDSDEYICSESEFTFFHPEEYDDSELTQWLAGVSGIRAAGKNYIIDLLIKYNCYPNRPNLIPDEWLWSIKRKTQGIAADDYDSMDDTLDSDSEPDDSTSSDDSDKTQRVTFEDPFMGWDMEMEVEQWPRELEPVHDIGY